jgi:hypothetical protein
MAGFVQLRLPRLVPNARCRFCLLLFRNPFSLRQRRGDLGRELESLPPELFVALELLLPLFQRRGLNIGGGFNPASDIRIVTPVRMRRILH